MSPMAVGALSGLALGIVGFIAMRTLERRVELEETKIVLKTAAFVDLVLFPTLGAFLGGLVGGV